MVACCIAGCKSNNKSLTTNNNEKKSKIRFFRIPSMKESFNNYPLTILQKKKQLQHKAWIRVINRSNLNAYDRVCSLHFASGAPAKCHDNKNIDWIPHINVPMNEEVGACSTPLVIVNVQSKYKAPNESFVQNMIPDPLDFTLTLPTPTMFDQTTSPLPVSEITQSLNVTNILHYIEETIGSELVLRFYKNGHKKWPADTNQGLFDLWKTIKVKADQESDAESIDDDIDGIDNDYVKIEFFDDTTLDSFET